MAQKSLFKWIRLIAVLIVIAAAGLLVWWFLIRQPPIPNSIIALSGRIEGDDSVVAAKTSGRIREIRVRELRFSTTSRPRPASSNQSPASSKRTHARLDHNNKSQFCRNN